MGDLGDFWRDVKAHRDTRTPAQKLRSKKCLVEVEAIIKRKIKKLQELGFDVKSTYGEHVGQLEINGALRIHPFYRSYQELGANNGTGQYKDLVNFVVQYFDKAK